VSRRVPPPFTSLPSSLQRGGGTAGTRSHAFTPGSPPTSAHHDYFDRRLYSDEGTISLTEAGRRNRMVSTYCWWSGCMSVNVIDRESFFDHSKHTEPL
jgi:hypothetical protein